jgi:hypothetical protein
MRLTNALPFIATIVLPVLAGTPVAAQTGSPQRVAEGFLAAVAQARWSEAAGALDLEAFKEYVDTFLARTGRPQSDRPLPTVAELRRQDPSMPREAAEWQIQQMRQAQQRYGDPTPFEFARVRSASELQRLDLREAAARWLEARDGRYSIPQQLAAMGCPAPSQDELPTPRRRVLGTVADGASIAYALFREEIDYGGPPAGGEIGVIELKDQRGRWLIQPRGDLMPELSIGMDGEGCPGQR